MKSFSISVFLFLGIFANLFAVPLTGTLTVPGTYASIALAIADLNAQGVGVGGVTFNVAPNYTETFTVTTAGLITATGTAANPIAFQIASAGTNPKITSATGTGTMDGIIILSGTDYITFDGIDVMDAAANTNDNMRMEWGYALLKNSGTNGSRNVIIKNCNISLNNNNLNSIGIYSNNHTSASIATLAVTQTTGANSNNQFLSNTISNVFQGIYVVGYADGTIPYTYYDQNNEIRLNAIANGSTTISSGTSYSSIYGDSQNELIIANNNIHIDGISASSFRSIYTVSGSNSNLNILNNTIVINYIIPGVLPNPTFFAIQNGMGSNGTNNTVNINDNIIRDLTFTALAAGSPVLICIQNTATCYNLNIASNIITNNIGRDAIMTTEGIATFQGISNTGNVVNSLKIFNNEISGNIIKSVSGFIRRTCSSNPVSEIYLNRIFDNNVFNGSGFIAAINGTGANSFYSNDIHDNTFTSSAVIDVYRSLGLSNAENIFDNTFKNIFSSGGVNGISATSTNSRTIYQNTISNLTSTTGAINGISVTAGTTYTISLNTICTLSSSGGGAVSGINVSGGTTGNLYSNKIYNLSSTTAAGTAYGMNITGGTTVNIYNNMIADVKAPAANTANAVNGLYLNGGTTINAYYNSVYLNATSSGNPFGSSGIYTSTTPTITLKNNLIVNNSTPSGTGLTVAHRRNGVSVAALTANYNSYYAGAPGASNVIGYDGTTSYQNLGPGAGTYKNWVASEAASISVDPGFTSTTDLHNTNMSNALAIVSTGTVIAGFTTDFDGDTRNCPEIGFDEWDNCGTPLPIDLLYFEAKRNGSAMQVRCDWSTATETNNDYFAIERSKDAITFSQIGTVLGHGTISTTSNYTFDDESPYTEWSYYRLKQVDYNGNYTYSNISTVYIGYLEITSLYPNPATDNITVSIATEQNTEATTEIYNSLGQTIYKNTTELQKGKTDIRINTNEYANGQYLFKVSLPTGEHKQKVFLR